MTVSHEAKRLSIRSSEESGSLISHPNFCFPKTCHCFGMREVQRAAFVVRPLSSLMGNNKVDLGILAKLGNRLVFGLDNAVDIRRR